MECVRAFPVEPPENELLLLVLVKNNRSRIEHFLKHYRNMGIKYFVFIDNGSTDGTIETVLEQQDTACFNAPEKYHSTIKTGWFNRVAAHYGYNRWYVIVDSDELFVYPEMDKLTIQMYTKILDSNDIDFVRAVLVDVYPDGPLMDENKTDEEYLESCNYFDRAETLSQLKNGGPRSRIFLDNAEKPSPHKPALMKFNNYFLTSSHTVYPRNQNDVPHGAAVLHYKFLPSDREGYVKIAQEGNYYKGSVVYKAINETFEKNTIINPMCELSVPFDAKTAWQHLPFIKNHVEGWDKLFLTGKYEKAGYKLCSEDNCPETIFLTGLINDFRFSNGRTINNILETDFDFPDDDKKFDLAILNGTQEHLFINLLRVFPVLHEESLVILRTDSENGNLIFNGWKGKKYQAVKLDENFYPAKRIPVYCIKISKNDSTLYKNFERLACMPLEHIAKSEIKTLEAFMQKHYDKNFIKKIIDELMFSSETGGL
jgi:glycosyltransferase involved in cell wall biosynthesis